MTESCRRWKGSISDLGEWTYEGSPNLTVGADGNSNRYDESICRYVKFHTGGNQNFGFCSFGDGSFFLFHRKLLSYEIKMLREDRTAAEWKMSLVRPAAGGESCKAGFFFIFAGSRPGGHACMHILQKAIFKHASVICVSYRRKRRK